MPDRLPASYKSVHHPRKRAFLAAYRQSGNIRAACEASDIGRQTYYDWCERDLVFAVAAQVAKEEFGDLLEAKLTQLALRDSNITALIVNLKMARRFVDRQQTEISGPEGRPIQLDVESRERLASRIASLAARAGETAMVGEPQ